MNTDLLNPIATIIFVIIIGFFVLVSILAIYIFIRYGQKKTLTVVISLMFVVVFLLGTLSAFASLQNLL